MKIMSYPNKSAPSGNDALVLQDNDTDTTKHISVINLLSFLYPIGSIYMNGDNSANPGSLLGFGTWIQYGAGQVPVGFDSTQAEFNAPGKTGGSKTVSLTGDQNGVHSHGVYDPGHTHTVYGKNGVNGSVPTTNDEGVSWGYRYEGRNAVSWSGTGIGIYNSGSGNPHNNLQPYITVYMWKRTA